MPLNSATLPIIINPKAGTAEDLSLLEEELRRHWEIVLHPTKHQGHARELAASLSAEGHPFLLVAGGDGTLNEVLNGLADSGFRSALGILPLGTGNDLTRSIYTCSDKPAVVEVLHRRHTVPVDVLRVRSGGGLDQFFINHSSMGFSALLSQDITSDLKSWIGPLAYPLVAVTKLPELIAYPLTLEFEAGERLEIEAINLNLCNGRFLGGGAPVMPTALLNDGLADLLLVPSMSVGALLNIAPTVLTGDHLKREELVIRRLRHLHLSTPTPLPINVDGEFLGEHRELRFDVLPGALRLIVDEASSACAPDAILREN